MRWFKKRNKDLDEKELRAGFSALSPDFSVAVFDEIDSTNTEARRRFEKDPTQSLFLIADRQTAGRGRLGRSFHSPAGCGLYCSFLFPLGGASPQSVVGVTSEAAVAVRRAVKNLTGTTLQIKWVNDLYESGKKVAGILCEFLQKDGFSSLVVGIGLNLRKGKFPAELRKIAGTLGENALSRTKLSLEIATELLPFLKNPADASWLEEYRLSSLVLGKEIVCIRGEEIRNALALGIDPDGGLRVRFADGSEEVLRSGEISVRPV